MGAKIAPDQLTESGERCLRGILDLRSADMPTMQFVSSLLIPLEAHVTRVVAQVIANSGAVGHPFVEKMLSSLEKEIFDTWPGRLSWLSRGFSVQIQGTAEYQRFSHLIEVRNAIVHGEGQLTEKQQKKDLKALLSLRKDLSIELDIECRGVHLSFGAHTRDRVFDIAISFLRRFDSEVLATFPGVKRF